MNKTQENGTLVRPQQILSYMSRTDRVKRTNTIIVHRLDEGGIA